MYSKVTTIPKTKFIICELLAQKGVVKLDEALFLEKKQALMSELALPLGFSDKDGDKFIFKWINCVPDEKLLKIRNAPNVLKNMRNTHPISLESHQEFVGNYHSIPRLDFICIHDSSGDVVGGLNIVNTVHGYEIGKYIGNDKYLQSGIAYPMSRSFISFIQDRVQEVAKINAVTKITNYKNINLNFKLGFKIIKLVDDHYWLMSVK
jgi:RimJ/RimL family protein N-acetyltransferase